MSPSLVQRGPRVSSRAVHTMKGMFLAGAAEKHPLRDQAARSQRRRSLEEPLTQPTWAVRQRPHHKPFTPGMEMQGCQHHGAAVGWMRQCRVTQRGRQSHDTPCPRSHWPGPTHQD